jgi:phage tail protein X
VASSGVRTLPLVAVLHRVPLFVEALTEAFDGLADVQPVKVGDGDVGGLLEALRPDALIVEAPDVPASAAHVPAVHVCLESSVVRARKHGEWTEVGVDLSPEAIRNALLRAMLRSET